MPVMNETLSTIQPVSSTAGFKAMLKLFKKIVQPSFRFLHDMSPIIGQPLG